MVQHHPSDDTLVEYAAGNIKSHLALCVSVHLQNCPQCRTQVQKLSTLGGALLETLPCEALDDAVFERILERVELVHPEPEVEAAANPLGAWLPDGLADLSWRKQWFKLYEYVLEVPKQGRWRLALQKISAGGIAPLHGHYGREVTVVLEGGFSDEMGVYEVGDFIVRDGNHNHRPRALEHKDCICLTYMEAPVRLTGPVGRWLERFRDMFLNQEDLASQST